MTTKTKLSEDQLTEIEQTHDQRRKELLKEKAGYEKERRMLADGAHDMRLEKERVEDELRALEKDEIKVVLADAG